MTGAAYALRGAGYRIGDATILDDRQARCLEDWLLRGRRRLATAGRDV